jgi:RNA polymerase sigma-70 factor (family 1)
VTRETFKQLFENHFTALRNYIYYRAGDKDLATDIAQDAFLRLWEKQPKEGVQQLKGLLYKMAGDMFISRYRHQKIETTFALKTQNANFSHTPEDEIIYQELNKSYQKALNAMPENLRVVFLMSRNEQLKNREIAEQLNVGIKAIEKRITQALAYLRKALIEQ